MIHSCLATASGEAEAEEEEERRPARGGISVPSPWARLGAEELPQEEERKTTVFRGKVEK